MAKKGLKKVGAAIKKQGQSKVGKVLKVAGAVGATALGVGLGVKAVKAGKVAITAAKAAKAVNAGKTVSDVAEKKPFLKGLFGGKEKVSKGVAQEQLPEKEKAALFLSGTDRLAKKLKKRATRNKDEKKQLDEAAKAINDELGNSSTPQSTRDAIQESLSGSPLSEYVRRASSGGSMDAGEDIQVTDIEDPRERTAKIVKGVAIAGGLGLAGWGLKKLLS
jgi:hypothetical protein